MWLSEFSLFLELCVAVGGWGGWLGEWSLGPATRNALGTGCDPKPPWRV